MAEINFYNIDCIEFMKTKPDNYYDLAIVDPPYDFSIGNKSNMYVSQGKYNKTQKTRPKGGFKIGGNYMDSISKPPTKEYFIELMRVSKYQIVFGGNYFTDILPKTSCWIVWDKQNGENYFGDFEMAWTSFGFAKRFIRMTVHEPNRIHPTQKPIKLYRTILQKFAVKVNANKILDTHGGSMTIAKACDMEGYDLDICEIDTEYFEAGQKRYNGFKQQITMF
jgi:site-specific DNA-methyltransferase (adenine-specific)